MRQQNKNGNVVAVVVTYNRKELLKEAIEALLGSSYKNLKILVADNASTDGTKEFIEDLVDGDKVIYKNTGANLGGAGGFSFGVKNAVIMGCDYVWLMDDDCIVQEDSLKELMDFAASKDNNFGFLSSFVKWKDGSVCKMNVQRKDISTRIDDFEQSQPIKMASFVSLLVRSVVVEDVGLPIKEFFIWGDDWEYTSRISQKYDCYFVSSSVVVHKSPTNIASDISKDTPDRLGRYFYAYRNEGYLYRKLGFKGKSYNFLKRCLHICRVLFSKSGNKFKKIGIIFKGNRAAKKFNPKIEYVYREGSLVNVIEFFAEPLSYGGQEAFMINMYKNFSDKNIHYTFFTPFHSDNKTLIELAKERGDEIISKNYNFYSKLRKKYIIRCAKEVFKGGNYQVAHIQSGSTYALLNVAKIAKKCGVKKVIVHSHCTGKMNLKYKVIKHFSDKKIKKFADVFFACSDLAAEWKFPKDIIENHGYTMVKNGIDIPRFTFDEGVRKNYREEFKIGKNLCFCNVGRLEEQKNQLFIVELLHKYSQTNPNFKCFLVGSGSLKQSIVEAVEKYNLLDKFIFLENRSDVAQIMLASDIFLFPSIFEGFPVTMIEAQATGLSVICSTLITTEAKITDHCEYLPLEDMDAWINKIEELKENLSDKRSASAKVVAEAGFDAKLSARLLENEYQGRR